MNEQRQAAVSSSDCWIPPGQRKSAHPEHLSQLVVPTPAAGDDRREWRNAGVFYARLDTGERWTLVEQAEDNSFRVAEDVDAACAFIQEAANRLLPRFISERYRLIVETRPVDAWFDDGPLRLRI